MGLFQPETDKLFLPKHGFKVDADNLAILIDHVESGKIVHLEPDLVASIAPGLSANPNAMYFVGSGVPISRDYDYNGTFQKGQDVLAIEMLRYEEFPKIAKNEPRYNLNRYVFGVSPANDKVYGVDVTTWKSNPLTGQVGNHWDEFYKYLAAHFPAPEER